MGYKLIGTPLGKGTFGTTYHAVWMNGDTDAGGQHVVVKHIPLARPENGILKYEAREVEILSSLHHKNVVKLLFAVQTPFALDLLLEVCNADLRSVLRHAMSEAEGKDAIRQICHGLEYVHARYVVHRDLKPADILLQNAGPFDLQVGRFWVSSATPALQGCGHWHRREPDARDRWQGRERDAHDCADHDIVVSSTRNPVAMS
jgi:serine/threonine protein kinase